MSPDMIAVTVGAGQVVDVRQRHPQLFERGYDVVVHVGCAGGAVDQYVLRAAHKHNARPCAAEGDAQSIDVRRQVNKLRHEKPPYFFHQNEKDKLIVM